MISIIIPMFRDAENALALAAALQEQVLPSDMGKEILIVDDGSDDGSAERLRAQENAQFRVLSLPRNMGRSKARNVGAEQAKGEILVFIDCDCRPTHTDFLAAHQAILNTGCVASCGHVTGTGEGFWSRYQQEASSRRARQHTQGMSGAGSSQNFAVISEIFHAVGGFDTRYHRYGFEDRDLFMRLSQQGTLGWCDGATVRHLDKLTLSGVLSKMQIAAKESALLFAQDHPAAYRQLGYAGIDVRERRWLRPAATLLSPFLRLAPWLDGLLVNNRLPYPLAKSFVKLLTAIAFMHGSTT